MTAGALGHFDVMIPAETGPHGQLGSLDPGRTGSVVKHPQNRRVEFCRAAHARRPVSHSRSSGPPLELPSFAPGDVSGNPLFIIALALALAASLAVGFGVSPTAPLATP